MKTDIFCKYAAAVSLCAAAFLFNAHGAPSWCKEEKQEGLCGQHAGCLQRKNVKDLPDRETTVYDETCPFTKKRTIKYIGRTSADYYRKTRTIIEYTKTVNKTGCDCPGKTDECKEPFVFQGNFIEEGLYEVGACA